MALNMIKAIVRVRRGSYASWQQANPILVDGQMGLINSGHDKGKIKIGDGVTRWNDLEYSIGNDGVTPTVVVEDFEMVDSGEPLEITNKGTGTDVKLSFKIPHGEKGDSPTIEIESYTQVESDQPLKIENVGTDTEVKLTFEIPKGEKGDAAPLDAVTSLLGVPNGIAILDSNGKVPLNMLPDLNAVEYTEDGTFIVPFGVTEIFVTAIAAGGKGGNGGSGSTNGSGGGGGSGGFGAPIVRKAFTVTPGQVIPITIGQASDNRQTIVGDLVTLQGGGNGGDGGHQQYSGYGGGVAGLGGEGGDEVINGTVGGVPWHSNGQGLWQGFMLGYSRWTSGAGGNSVLSSDLLRSFIPNPFLTIGHIVAHGGASRDTGYSANTYDGLPGSSPPSDFYGFPGSGGSGAARNSIWEPTNRMGALGSNGYVKIEVR